MELFREVETDEERRDMGSMMRFVRRDEEAEAAVEAWEAIRDVTARGWLVAVAERLDREWPGNTHVSCVLRTIAAHMEMKDTA